MDQLSKAGLTIWNLNGVSVTNVEGQLHVIVLDVEAVSNDDFYFKHIKIDPINEL